MLEKESMFSKDQNIEDFDQRLWIKENLDSDCKNKIAKDKFERFEGHEIEISINYI